MSLWGDWCEQVTRDVQREATSVESAELRQPYNLIPWLRGLNYAKADVDVRIGDAKLRIRAAAPMPGCHPSAGYLEAKKLHDVRHARRIRFKHAVEARIAECRHLLDVYALDSQATLGGMVSSMAQVADLLERDDVEGALSLAKVSLSWVGHLEPAEQP